ncbi:MAG: hypothetical protein JW881_15810 [Spirochaetales bacterium]|nr:hypothetical protein [Spirochaetales bacterium]
MKKPAVRRLFVSRHGGPMFRKEVERNDMSLFKRYFLYLLRWQLSTPILAACVYLLTKSLGPTITTIIANIIGGLLFFWVDSFIFRRSNILFTGELWEIKDHISCADCEKKDIRGYRLIKAANYDKTQDRHPEFRCHECSRAKYERRKKGGS